MDALRDESQHLFRDIETPQLRCRLLFVEDAREAPLAAADVQHAPPAQFAQVLADQLYVIDARIDGRREVLFVA